MRAHSTRPPARSIHRAVRNGNASVDRSAAVSVGEQLAGAGPLHVELGELGGDVGDDRGAVAGRAAEPGQGVAVRGVGGDDEEVVVGELGHGQVGLDAAVLVEPLRVGDGPGAPSTAPAETRSSTAPASAPRHPELRHEAHVHQADALTDRSVLGLPLLEPRRPPPRRLGARRDARPGEPVGALPAGHLAQVAALLDQPVVHGGEQHVSGRVQLLSGRVRGVDGAEDLGGARARGKPSSACQRGTGRR